METLEIREARDVVVVSFKQTKVLDQPIISQIGAEFANLTTEAAAERRLLLNFSNVKFMASAMIGQILLLHKQCKKDRIDLKLCGISSDIMVIFKVMKLTKLLRIYDSESTALAAFGSPRRSWFR